MIDIDVTITFRKPEYKKININEVISNTSLLKFLQPEVDGIVSLSGDLIITDNIEMIIIDTDLRWILNFLIHLPETLQNEGYDSLDSDTDPEKIEIKVLGNEVLIQKLTSFSGNKENPTINEELIAPTNDFIDVLKKTKETCITLEKLLNDIQ